MTATHKDAGPSQPGAALQDEFYLQFENALRGDRQAILARLQAYSDVIAALRGHFPDGSALDIGSGRGEWLQFLQEAGWVARGLDVNPVMVQVSRAAGLDAVHSDALQYLASVPSGSLPLVSAFHVVEHMPFGELNALVAECHRVLHPGGLLILETPNPQNLLVGSSEFYLDPTHQKPLPPNLLKFVVRNAGYEQVRIVFNNASATGSPGAAVPQLRDVIYGTGFDYAVLAVKGDPSEGVLDLRRLQWRSDLSLANQLNAFDARMHDLQLRVDAAFEFYSEARRSPTLRPLLWTGRALYGAWAAALRWIRR